MSLDVINIITSRGRSTLSEKYLGNSDTLYTSFCKKILIRGVQQDLYEILILCIMLGWSTLPQVSCTSGNLKANAADMVHLGRIWLDLILTTDLILYIYLYNGYSLFAGKNHSTSGCAPFTPAGVKNKSDQIRNT